ncbi:MAG: hypothetical protein CL462_07090 [Acidimicrobiaceae bacterium]|nr:hypothetical protein [Acidimicrobiaceae bacterium]|tara:strand:- start:569 stop:1972 length:1404 start_codon:yes stop_codon:yes gene_type:complete
MIEKVVSDYLVVGAGAMGMAFTDVLMTETDATVTIVDRHSHPGGHWNDSYPFVRLHQPSSFYGVNSRELGNDTKDLVGGNAGLYELASGTEVVTYFDQVMNQQFLPSGRVRYLPTSEYLGDGLIRDLISGIEVVVDARKTVNATYMNVTVPAVTTPSYDVMEGVQCIPPNELPSITTTPDGYVVIGGGKTAIDSCLWLLSNDVNPEIIRWVLPRDQWMLDRAYIQPGPEFADRVMLRQVETMEIVAASTSLDQMFDRLLENGALLQLDPAVRPTMYRCCTVTSVELNELQRISNVVRLGRVRQIGLHDIDLDDATVSTSPNTIHVDCTADGLARRPIRPVFEDGLLTLQTVRSCQQVFSAAFIAHVEATYDGETIKNELCTVVPHPDDTLDWVRTTLENALNSIKWNADPGLKTWLSNARLDGFSGRGAPRQSAGPSGDDLLGRIREVTPSALKKLAAYLDEGRKVN